MTLAERRNLWHPAICQIQVLRWPDKFKGPPLLVHMRSAKHSCLLEMGKKMWRWWIPCVCSLSSFSWKFAFCFPMLLFLFLSHFHHTFQFFFSWTRILQCKLVGELIIQGFFVPPGAYLFIPHLGSSRGKLFSVGFKFCGWEVNGISFACSILIRWFSDLQDVKFKIHGCFHAARKSFQLVCALFENWNLYMGYKNSIYLWNNFMYR